MRTKILILFFLISVSCNKKEIEVNRDFFINTKENYDFKDVKELKSNSDYLYCYRNFGLSMQPTKINGLDYYELNNNCSKNVINIKGFIRHQDSCIYWISKKQSYFDFGNSIEKEQILFSFNEKIGKEWKCYLNKDSILYWSVKLKAKDYYRKINDNVYLFSIGSSDWKSKEPIYRTILYGISLNDGFLYICYEIFHSLDVISLFPIQQIELNIPQVIQEKP